MMTKRRAGYVGMPLEKQSEDHKAPTLTKRGKSYRAGARKEPENSMRKRAAAYEYGYADLFSEGTESTSPLTKRAQSYRAGARREAENSLAKRGKKYSASVKDIHPYAVNSQFSLKIGSYTIKCSRISNLSMAQEVEEVPEGGNSLYPNIFTGPSKKADVLVIERALVNDAIAENFKPGVYVGESTISVMQNGEVYKELGFDEGMVIKCELSNLDALGNEVMIQKIEIAHTGLYTW